MSVLLIIGCILIAYAWLVYGITAFISRPNRGLL